MERNHKGAGSGELNFLHSSAVPQRPAWLDAWSHKGELHISIMFDMNQAVET